MADDSSMIVKVSGLEELDRWMDAFPAQLNYVCVRRGIQDAGNFLAERARSRAPVMSEASPNREPGELRDSIEFLFDRDDELNPRRVGGTVSPTYEKSEGNQSPGVWGKFVEYGSVHNQPWPYLRPTIDEDGEEAVNVFVASTAAAMEQLPDGPMPAGLLT